MDFYKPYFNEMKYIKFAYILLAAVLPSYLFGQTANINLSAEKQLIRGFGGINHPTWYSDLNASERELAYGNGPGQLGFTVLRTYVSDNSSEWGLGLKTAQYAFEQGARVFASPWNPPSGMSITVNGVKRINPATYGQYADHLNSYVTYMKDNGVDLYAISTQNEPDYAHDWTEWSPQESVDFIKGYADRINCRLMSPESFQYRKNIYDAILNDPAALKNVDIFGTHLYGTQYKDFPYPAFEQKGAGKELWMTEVYTDSKYDANIWSDTYINDSRHALKVAEHIHYAMVDGNFQTYVFWPLRRYYAMIHDGNPDNQGNSPAAAGTATKRGYCMAQFSKWVRPGYVRVDATKSPATNVFVSAYKKDNDVVIVVVNKNTSSKTLTISIPGSQVKTWEAYTTSASKNIAKGTDISGSTSFQVTLEAASVTTFVGMADAGAPSVSLLGLDDGDAFSAPATLTLDATASDDDGTIAHVEYFVNGKSVKDIEAASYSFEYTFEQAGEYTIKVVAYDDEGKTGEDAVSIVVNVPQGPYGGSPHVIPGTIELEEYDVGGNGFAYYDTSEGNEGGADYRMDEDVDIEDCSDAGGGYNLGWTISGEWAEYTVDVKTSGIYGVTIRASCNGDDRTVTLESDGQVIAKDIAIPNTGGWQEWTDVVVEGLELQAGEQVLKLTIGATDYVNLNSITFVRTSQGPEVTISEPVAQGAYNSAQTITLAADAVATDAEIADVKFYADGTLLSTDDAAPYSFDWSGMTSGTFEIKVVASDSNGLTGEASVTIVVNEAPVLVPLKAGWNLIGCPIAGSTALEKALASIWDKVEVVKDFDGFYDKTMPAELNSLSKLDWGKGYFVKVTETCDLDWDVE